MGTLKALPTSEGWSDERESRGLVVKPTWLLTTMWMVPPVVYLRSCARCSVSYTTPWPENAASPCIRMPMHLSRVVSPLRSCAARTFPTTTGLTASRCDGFATNDRCTLRPSGYVRS